MKISEHLEDPVRQSITEGEPAASHHALLAILQKKGVINDEDLKTYFSIRQEMMEEFAFFIRFTAALVMTSEHGFEKDLWEHLALGPVEEAKTRALLVLDRVVVDPSQKDALQKAIAALDPTEAVKS